MAQASVRFVRLIGHAVLFLAASASLGGFCLSPNLVKIHHQNTDQKGQATTPVAAPGKQQTKHQSCPLGQICETLGVVAIPVPAANAGTTPGAAPVHVKAEGVQA
jgi:hypothetical protein